MAVIAKSMQGSEGKVTLPGMGALIGEMYNWQAYSEDGKTYVLRASCNSLHDSLWEAAGDQRRIEISIGRDVWYVAVPTENAAILRNGRNFTIKTVTFEKLETYMAATKTASPTEADIADNFNTIEVTHKGTTYSFRELSAEEYDAAVEVATHGEGDDKNLDTVQLLRWMIIKGSVEPKLDPATLGKLPFSAVTKISKAVNDLHFAPDEDEAEAPAEPPAEDAKPPNS